MNFNAKEAAGRVEWKGGAFDKTLPAFGYEVVRVRGKSVEECRGANDDCQKRQLSTNDKNANVNERVDSYSDGFASRIVTVINALFDEFYDQKVVLFTNYPETFELYKEALSNAFPENEISFFGSGMDIEEIMK